MSKSNLSADAQCFIPSKENRQNIISHRNLEESYNYSGHRNYTRQWYDVTQLCSNLQVNQPSVVSMFNNFYPNDELKVDQFTTLQTHQDGKQLGNCSKSVTKTTQESQQAITQDDRKPGEEIVRTLEEGRIIVSKSSKKRKAKKKRIAEANVGVNLNSNLHVEILDCSSQIAEEAEHVTKSTRSWSEVVNFGYAAISNRSNVSKTDATLKPSLSVKSTENTNKHNKISETKIAGGCAQVASKSNKNQDIHPQKIKILQRNEKLEDVLKETQASAKKKKDKQPGKPKRSHSSELPIRKKKPQFNKAVKLTDKPITLNIFEMISMSKKSKEVRTDWNSITKSHKTEAIKKGPNFLDSAAIIKRGKEREKPKEKKPTKLRKVILKDRMLRRSKFLQGLGLLETRSLERLNVECDLPLVIEDDVKKIEFPSHSSNLEHLQDVDPRVLSSVHSRRFREYCNQVVNKEINDCCTTFLKELVRFQDNQFHKDPVKARMRRRLVFGLREVLKFLGVKKIKCVIISPNVEKVQSEGGLEEKIEMIITGCQLNNIPFIFALNRRQLGFTCLKKVPVSVVGILNYDGAEAHFHKLKGLTESAREKYKEMLSKLTDDLAVLDLEDNNPVPRLVDEMEPSCSGFNMQREDSDDEEEFLKYLTNHKC